MAARKKKKVVRKVRRKDAICEYNILTEEGYDDWADDHNMKYVNAVKYFRNTTLVRATVLIGENIRVPALSAGHGEFYLIGNYIWDKDYCDDNMFEDLYKKFKNMHPSLDEVLEYLETDQPLCPPCGVVLGEGVNRFAIINGDETSNDFVDYFAEIPNAPVWPTVSMMCLIQLLFSDNDISVSVRRETMMWQVYEWLLDGSLKLVDFSPDSTKTMTANQIKQWSNPTQKHLVNVPVGFSVVGNTKFHRSASCVFWDMDQELSILVGQDEGSYFGCVFEGEPKDMNEAYYLLAPESARNTKTKKLINGIQRHGEWFFIPVDSAMVPVRRKDFEYSLLDITDGAHIALPRDDAESATHTMLMYSDGRFVCTPDHEMFAKRFTVIHSEGDHDDIRFSSNQWYKVEENTAIASVSVDGVD